MKRLQNRIAESRIALPIVACYAAAIWLTGGLISHGWWLQFACFALSTYLMLELNNSNALIRIYSRMVSCSYLALCSAACFLFSSLTGGIASFFMIAAIYLLFRTYQNRSAMGLSFYGFLCISIASIHSPVMLFYIPFFWIMMAINLRSLNIRTFGATILGLLLPYWFVSVWLFYHQQMEWFESHFSSLITFSFHGTYQSIPASIWIYIMFITVIALIGIIHYLNNSYQDKIRIRLLFESFVTLDIVTFVFLILQPQHYDMLLRIIIANTAPLIGHFIALTHTRFTNISFYLLIITTLILTAYNLWTYSFSF